MSTKYRNPASVAQERVLELSSQWNKSHSYSASWSNDDQGSSGEQKPGKGLIKETRSNRSNYAAEEDANLGDPDAEWKSGNAHWHSSKAKGSNGNQSEDEKARQTQPKGDNAQKYAKEEDDSLSPENTGAPTKGAKKSGNE